MQQNVELQQTDILASQNHTLGVCSFLHNNLKQNYLRQWVVKEQEYNNSEYFFRHLLQEGATFILFYLYLYLGFFFGFSVSFFNMLHVPRQLIRFAMWRYVSRPAEMSCAKLEWGDKEQANAILKSFGSNGVDFVIGADVCIPSAPLQLKLILIRNTSICFVAAP